MDSPDSTTLAYALIAIVSIGAVASLLSQPTDFTKWLQKKYYQYQVTFALYMLTPTERFIFNSVLFLFVSMTLIAGLLYLPNHILTISRRAFYYWAGDTSFVSTSQRAAESFWQTASMATDAVKDAANGLAGTAYQAAVNTSAAAQEVLGRAAAAGAESSH